MDFKVFPLSEVILYDVASYFIDADTDYVFGGKVESIRQYPPILPENGIDCSGFMRYLLFRSAGIDICDGTYTQNIWLSKYGLKLTSADNNALLDNHFRLNVHLPDSLDETGHIWLCQNARTTECYGGHGVGHRDYNATLSSGHSLNDLASRTYVIT